MVAVVAAQEVQWVFSTKNRATKPGAVNYDFVNDGRRVGVYYFYVFDRDFGPGFIKICTCFPYLAKVWLNGHEWARRQAADDQIGFAALTNGFAVCDDPAGLQGICDCFGPADVQAFFDRWTARNPDAAHGCRSCRWELSVRQVEVSRAPAVFSSPSLRTTSAWADPTRWQWLCPPAAPPDRAPYAPGSSHQALR